MSALIYRVECEGGEVRGVVTNPPETYPHARGVDEPRRWWAHRPGSPHVIYTGETALAAVRGVAHAGGWPVVSILAPGEPTRAELTRERDDLRARVVEGADREVAAYDRCAALCERRALMARERQARASATGRTDDCETWRRVALSADEAADAIRTLSDEAGARRDAMAGGTIGPRVAEVREAIAALGAGGHAPSCAICGEPATCFGSSEGDPPSCHCDDCCGHGGEDGRCEALAALGAAGGAR